MTEVEIFWPADAATHGVTEAVELLQRDGIEATCRLQPIRRGADTAVLILVTTTTLQPFLSAAFGHLGGDTYRALQGFVGRLFHGGPPAGGARGPGVVVFESSASGAQFVFTADLPMAAYQQAMELDPGERPGRWAWQSSERSWRRFEEVRARPGEV